MSERALSLAGGQKQCFLNQETVRTTQELYKSDFQGPALAWLTRSQQGTVVLCAVLPGPKDQAQGTRAPGQLG